MQRDCFSSALRIHSTFTLSFDLAFGLHKILFTDSKGTNITIINPSPKDSAVPMLDHQIPQLPLGELSIISTLSQSLSFHSSPESFIAARAQPSPIKHSSPVLSPETENTNPSSLPIIRARILNRNVAIVTSHPLCTAVLQAGQDDGQQHKEESMISAANEGETVSATTFAAKPAYDDLMTEFFPAPNLLLFDASDHATARSAWDAQLATFPAEISSTARDHVKDFISGWKDGDRIDIYESMKDLSWRILLGVFLQLDTTQKDFSVVETLQETLLRGQFSLFPMSVNVGLWRSPRSKAIAARRKLQSLLRERTSNMDSGCPFKRLNRVSEEELASNALLFTSSIAVKALASLLTASLLNIFLQPVEPRLAVRIRLEGTTNGPILLNSILLETERLSPPVIGVMRRVQQDVVFASLTDRIEPPTLVPAGWDIWLYFAGAGRDESVFQMAHTFVAERFVASRKHGFAFGGGSKTCLGEGLVREIVRAATSTMLASGIRMDGEVAADGVRGWLGWDADVGVQAIARDLKQLPCQRPKEPIYVRIKRNSA